MAHLLKNKNLEVHIDLPTENYQLFRFDWTGKITTVIYQGRSVVGREVADLAPNTFCGKGFYNEFGINSPLGYEEAELGSWFHKIGIGLLRKEEEQYDFNRAYEIRPAEFTVAGLTDGIRMECRSAYFNGYSYRLEKNIQLLESGFRISYCLENTGQKTIATEEYNHNFLALDQESIGRNYLLQFPFQIKPVLFGETVNPEQLVTIGSQDITFKGTPRQAFFFSNLSGGVTADAHWKLVHTKHKIEISETGNFPTHSVNLWGMGHVISPELFIDIVVKPGQIKEWSRTYRIRLV